MELGNRSTHSQGTKIGWINVSEMNEVAELQNISELKNIKDFPLDKYDRIVLYLLAE